MRRNEMLKIMHDLISEDLCTREEFNVEDCDRLLTAMEAAGMLPAVYYPFECCCSTRSKCPNCSPDEYKMYNTWEEK